MAADVLLGLLDSTVVMTTAQRAALFVAHHVEGNLFGEVVAVAFFLL